MFRSKTAFAVIASAIGLLMAGAAMTPSRAADPGITDDEITIGMFGPLSGPLIAYGIDPVQASKMLYEEANKKGGVHGRKIKLIVEDDKCNPNDIVSVVEESLKKKKVFMLP